MKRTKVIITDSGDEVESIEQEINTYNYEQFRERKMVSEFR